MGLDDKLFGREDSHGFFAGGADGRVLAAEKVGNDLLHFRLLENGAGFDGHLARHGAAEALASVAEFLNHGAFIFDENLVEEGLEFAFFNVRRGGGDDKGCLAEHTDFEAVAFQFGEQFGEAVGVGRGEVAVDREEQLLAVGGGLVFHEAFEEDALMGGLLVDYQESGG